MLEANGLFIAFLVLFLLVAIGLIAGAVVLIRKVGSGKVATAQSGNRDRALLARLEELDDRLEQLERTLHDLPS